MNVTRSIVCGVVGPCKTESSQKPVPIRRSNCQNPRTKFLCGFLGCGGVVGPFEEFAVLDFAAAKWRLFGHVAHVCR
jgi:hypothetical protein